MTDMIKHTPDMNIERTGTTSGRCPRYNLIVNGVDVGSLRRYSAITGWRIHGTARYLHFGDDREAAEAYAIKLAVRAGLLCL